MINKLIVAIAAFAAAGAASAQPQFSDAQYLSAARCQALMGSAALGRMNTSEIDKALDKAGAGRVARWFPSAPTRCARTLVAKPPTPAPKAAPP